MKSAAGQRSKVRNENVLAFKAAVATDKAGCKQV